MTDSTESGKTVNPADCIRRATEPSTPSQQWIQSRFPTDRRQNLEAQLRNRTTFDEWLLGDGQLLAAGP